MVGKRPIAANRRPSKPSVARPPIAISQHEARLLSLQAQALDLVPSPTEPSDKTAVLAMIRRLGAVQLDSISVVARSHETVLWSRLGPFDRGSIADLYSPDNQIAEYWAHAAAIVPIELMPYFRRRMMHYRDPASDQYQAWQPDEAVNAAVLSTIQESGPLPSRAFERPEGPRPSPWTWWGGKPAKKALDFLWTAGHLTIIGRERFQRVYELMDRRFPDFHRGPLPSVEEEQLAFVGRALAAMGVGTAHWISDYFRTGGQAHVALRQVPVVAASLVDRGDAIPIAIGSIAEPAWMHRAMLPVLDEIRSGNLTATRTVVLSPFDSLVWNRRRGSALFDFDYRLECYTPAPKRIFGYYSLPILHRGAMVGRLDPSFDRKRGILTIKSLHLEPHVEATPLLAHELSASLRNYAGFLGGIELTFGQNVPATLVTRFRGEGIT